MKKINLWIFFLTGFILSLFLLTAFFLTKLVIGETDFTNQLSKNEASHFSYDTFNFSFKNEEFLPLKIYIIVNKDFIFDKEIEILKEILEKIPELDYEIIEEKKIENLEKGLIVLLEKTKYDNKVGEMIKNKIYQGSGILLIKNPQTKENISLLSHIAGVIPIENNKTIYQEILLKGETPITFNMKVGDFLGISGEKSYFLKPLEKRVNIAGYYKFRDEAIVYGHYNEGRYVVFGFSLVSLTGDSFTQRNIKRLLENAINWLTKRPVIQIKYWPDNKEYAFIFTCDVEHQGENWQNIAKIVNNGTFFFLTSELKNFNQKDIENLEIALHGLEHEPLKGKSYKEQERLISKGKDYLEKKLKRKIFGLRPPELLFDSSTLKILKNYNFLYFISQYKLGLPFLPYFSSIISIPQTIPDDYDLMIRNNINDSDSLLFYFKKHIENLKRINGLVIFSIHTHLVGSNSYQPLVETIIDLIKNDNKCFFAQAKKVAEWWLKRTNIRLINNKLNEIEIENLNDEAVEGIVLKYFPATNQIEKGEILLPIKKLAGKEKRKISLIYKND